MALRLLTIAGILNSCVSAPVQTEKGRAVFLTLSAVEGACQSLGTVEWEGDSRSSMSDVKVALREKVAAMGGNTLRLDKISNPATLYGYVPRGHGMAFRCPGR